MFDRPRLPIRQALLEGGLPSSLQARRYRRRGYRIAADVELGPGVVIEADEVDIGPGCAIGTGTVLRGKSIRLGRRVSIGALCFFDGGHLSFDDDAVIREQVFAGGPMTPESSLTVGRRARVFQTCFFNHSLPLSIGDDTGVGGKSSIFTHGSWQSAFEGYPVTFEPVSIGKRVWLPWHVFVLPGVTIGDGATIGGGSVVNKDVPPGALAAGLPAKVLRESDSWPRPITDDERISTARDVLVGLADFLRDNGVEVLSESVDVLSVALPNGTRRRVVLGEAGAQALGHPSDLHLILDGEPPADERFWFHLRQETKRSATSDPFTVEVEQWLNRFGVRFQPADEL